MWNGILEGWYFNWVAGVYKEFGNFVADLVVMLFNSDSTTITGEASTADLEVVEAAGLIVLVLAVPFTLAAVIWQIMRSSAEGRLKGILRAVIGGIGMVILSRIVFWYGPEAITGFDAITAELIRSFMSSPGGIVDALLESFGLNQDPDTEDWGVDLSEGIPGIHPTWMIAAAANSLFPIIPVAVLLVLTIGVFMVMFMLAFRRWALIVMLALAPLALMFLPAEKAGRSIGLKWLQVVVALLAAKPLAALLVAITGRLLLATGEVSLMMLLVAIITFLVAAASPLIAMKFFGFLQIEIGNAYAAAAGEGAMRSAGAGAGRLASQARSWMPRGGSQDSAATPIAKPAAAVPAASTITPAAAGAAGAAGGGAAKAGAVAGTAASGPAAPVVGIAAAAAMSRAKPKDQAGAV